MTISRGIFWMQGQQFTSLEKPGMLSLKYKYVYIAAKAVYCLYIFQSQFTHLCSLGLWLGLGFFILPLRQV